MRYFIQSLFTFGQPFADAFYGLFTRWIHGKDFGSVDQDVTLKSMTTLTVMLCKANQSRVYECGLFPPCNPSRMVLHSQTSLISEKWYSLPPQPHPLLVPPPCLPKPALGWMLHTFKSCKLTSLTAPQRFVSFNLLFDPLSKKA